jgi:hypothetical protein
LVANREDAAIESMLPPLIVRVNGIAVPAELVSSVQGFVPNFTLVLNVILITLFSATFTALKTGSELLTIGGELVVNLVDHGPTNPVPARSVILFECSVTRYIVLVANREEAAIESTLPPLIVRVNGIAVPAELVNSIQGFVPNITFLLK